MTNDDDDDAIRLLTLLDDDDADETIILTFWKRSMRTSFEITRIAKHTSVRRDVWHVTLGPGGRPIALKAMGPQILLLVRGGHRIYTALHLLGLQLLPIHSVRSTLRNISFDT